MNTADNNILKLLFFSHFQELNLKSPNFLLFTNYILKR